MPPITENSKFFDSCGEGPHSLKDVQRWAEGNPAAAREFHLSGYPHITFDKVLKHLNSIESGEHAA